METLYILVLLFLVVTPPCIAYARGHKGIYAIVVFSVFLNWTVLGFLVSLIWSCNSNTKQNT